MRIAVLASGSGTILEAILDERIDVALVVVDRRCRAPEAAALAGVRSVLVERTDFTKGFDRDDYTDRIVGTLEEHEIDLVVMAGFGTVLGAALQEVYAGKVVNTHPSLLPAFPGWHAVEDAIAHGVKVTGCTVHLVTLEVDAGPILAQEAVPVLPGDTPGRLHERIKATERRLYPRTIRQLIQGALP
ncbi:MAG: phosphoribosylglycinamide formyltransferase [Acidimicrobiales bacterium]